MSEPPSSAPPDPRGDRPVLLLVHGTGDGPGGVGDFLELHLSKSIDEKTELLEQWRAGERWWQTGSRFLRRLDETLEDRHGGRVMAAVEPFMWNGANSEKERTDAAKQLAWDIRMAARRGPVHILAHSHGGNVVRRALEELATETDVVQRVASVTTFGAPFFIYSDRWRTGRALLFLAIAATIAGAFFAALNREAFLDSLPMAALMLASALAVAGFGLAVRGLGGLFGARSQARRTARGAALRIAWRNYCSVKDEAIGLLASFNAPIRLMRGPARKPERHPWETPKSGSPILYWILILPLLVLTGFITGQIIHLIETGLIEIGAPDFVQNAHTVIGVAAFAVGAVLVSGLAWVGWLLFERARQLALLLLDVVITERFRTLAFGDDVAAGIRGVSADPWARSEGATVALPLEVETEIEAYIAASTGKLWANLRERLAGNTPLLAQNLPRLVQDTLTWNELAHTVYSRVDGFIDLVAADLVATGDWRRRRTRRRVDSARS